jgi:hypothetical protein
MDFASYLNQAWNGHATEPEKIAKDFRGALPLLETAEQINQLAGLVTHVMGEHLAQWENGISFLQLLRQHTHPALNAENESTVLRSIAVLQMGSGRATDLTAFSLSDQIRILAGAASALGERETNRATDLLNQALLLVGTKSRLEKGDPAHRALAVTGNNLAWKRRFKNGPLRAR